MSPLATTTLLDPFTSELTRLATVELVVLGVACGALGAWVVQLGRAFLAESLTHALLPGLVVGSLTGVGLLAGAALGTGAAFGATTAAGRAPRTTPAAATAVAVTALLGAGALLATQVQSPGLLERLLFGDPLGVADGDLAGAAALTLFVIAALWLLRRVLAAYAFEAGGIAALGVSAAAVEWTFLALLSLTVAACALIAGALLAPALVIAPALGLRSTAVHAARRPLAAGVIGGACGAAGVYASYVADLPVSAAVALCCCASALAPAGVRAARTTFRRRRRSSQG